MDMDASQNSWLAFSLSHQPCLFQAFSTQHHEAEAAEDQLAMLAAAAAAAEEPKLEDFLGCVAGESRFSVADSMCVDDSDLKTIAAAGFLCATACGDNAATAPPPKAVDTFGQRTSIYRGVTRHRWTGRYEAHLWDNSCRREGQSRKGRQVYLGGYDKEEKAARAYDLAALKYWGPATTTNFPVSNYENELEEMKVMTRQEFVASLRRKSSGFSRGASIYRGVTRHHQHGRWQARIGRVAGNKDIYLGTFSTQEEAAEAYDIAAIKFRGLNAVTNFDMSRYDINSIMTNNLPVGGGGGISGGGRTSKLTTESSSSSTSCCSVDTIAFDTKTHNFPMAAATVKPDQDYWSLLALHQHQHQQQPSFGLYSSSGASMDFSGVAAGGGIVAHNTNLVWNNGILQPENHHQAQSDCCSTIPYATPMAYESVIGSGGGSNYVGSWPVPTDSTASPFYGHQAGKPSMAFFQTPIYGME